MNPYIKPVALDKAYRLINHGPTVLISSRHDSVDNVMAASWACMLDFSPARVMVVLGKNAMTRSLIERSGEFIVQVPTVAQMKLTGMVGTTSLHDAPNKLDNAGVQLFSLDDRPQPFVAGCAAWMACTLRPESHNQETYDLFIGDVTGAWADSRVFRDGRWHYETADAQWRSIHYIAGGHFYAIGEAMHTGGEEMP